jgi:hypothetical protein
MIQHATRTIIPEETTSANDTNNPAPVKLLTLTTEQRISRGLDQGLSQHPQESTDMLDFWELDTDSLVDYLDEVDNPDWQIPETEVSELDFGILETAGPKAAQSGDIYPANSN